MNRHMVCAAFVATIGATAAFVSPRAVADVTEAKTMSFDMGFGKINSTITEQIAGDKRRTDTDVHCDGFLLSILCAGMRGGEIVRLDKNVSWQLEPKKKSYVEMPFPTPEQIAAAKEKRVELLDKLKSCPQPAERPAPDTSKCEMSPPQFEVQKTDETAMIAGHEARRSWIAMKQTCTNKETGDACEFDVRFDSWMTRDQIPEIKEESAFLSAYDRKMGLDEATIAAVGPQLQQFMAPYASALKQVGAKAVDMQGTPLKTTVSISVGGPHCGAARDHRTQQTGGVTADAGGAATVAAENSTTAASGAAAEAAVTHATGGSLLGAISGSAAGAFSRTLVGGLFAKKSSAPQKSEPTPPSVGGNSVPLISFTTETTEIRSGPIPSDQFDIPAGWALRQAKARKNEEAFSCPKVGG